MEAQTEFRRGKDKTILNPPPSVGTSIGFNLLLDTPFWLAGLMRI
uniref:Uncharacterized protein n=1 Tax=Rhizophora mucronata TaxID=61149 RepID=A0A2P2J1K8_RHIMU